MTSPNAKGTTADDLKIEEASVQDLTVRAAILSPPGAGKTFGALVFAKGLAGDGMIVVIDTERGRSKNYAKTIGFKYHVIVLPPPHSPERYIAAMRKAAKAGAKVVVIDSMSHEWTGDGGVLQQVDASDEKNRFFAWRGPSKAHTQVLEAMVGSPVDVIATIRTKIGYEIEDQAGKKVPKRVGLQPVQREGVEYQFDLVFEVDQISHEAKIQKCNAGYHGVVLQALAESPKITTDLGRAISAWRQSTESSPDYVPPPAPAEIPDEPAAPEPPAKPRARRAKPPAETAAGNGQTAGQTPANPTPTSSGSTGTTSASTSSSAASSSPSGTPPATSTPSSSPAPSGTASTGTTTPAATPAPADAKVLTIGSAVGAAAVGAVAGGEPDYSVDDSVYDVAEVPEALAASVKALNRTAEISMPLWKDFHAWLMETLGGKKKDAMAAWQNVGVVAGGKVPTGRQVQDLVFNLASVRIANTPQPASK